MKSLTKVLIALFFSGIATLAAAADGPPLTVVLPDLPAGQEMLVLEIDLEPGQASAPHRHNAHVFVYVLEGKINMQVAGEEMVTLSPGDMFYENPENIHMVSQNASTTETAKFLVHMLRTPDTPVSIPVE